MDFSALAPDLAQFGAPLIADLLTTAATVAGGPAVGAIVGLVTKAIAAALGAKSAAPADISDAIRADPDKAKAVLPRVEADHADLVASATAQAKVDFENTRDARAATAELAKSGSLIAWGAPAVSTIAVSGFVGVACIVLFGHGGESPGAQQILGAMTVGWTTVLTYWLGSSKGSADKTGELAAIARTALARNGNVPARKGGDR